MKDAIDRILAAAITAPSSHNTQPWRFRADGDSIEVWGDPDRMLPRSDADHRQFFISLGCATENIVAAAAVEGFDADVAMSPDPKEALFVARVFLKREGGIARNTDLGEAIRARHANREPYQSRPVPPEFLSFVRGLASADTAIMVIEDEAQKTALARVAADATEAAFRDKGFTEELSHWIKPSLKRYRDGMPGYNVGIPWPLSFVVPLAVRYGNMAKQQRKMVEGPLRATPAYIVIATRDDDSRAWVNSGMLFERMWLHAVTAQMAMGPLAAPIQIGEFYKEVQRVLATPLRPQVFARLGYPTKIHPKSPRRPLAEILLHP